MFPVGITADRADKTKWRAAGAVSGITLASRVLGMIRDALMMAVMGAGWASGTFFLVWMLPNLLRRLFGEGALTASFIPVYTRVLRNDGDSAARSLLAQVSGVVLMVLLGLVALVALASFLIPADALSTTAEGAGRSDLFVSLCRILFPYAVPICLVALYAGALNCHRVFALPAAAPIVLNVFWITGLLAAAAIGMETPEDVAVLVAACLLAGGAVQLATVAVPLARRGALAPPRMAPPRDSAAREVFAAMAPTVLGMSLVQISALVDQGIAYFLVSPGANNYVHLANRLLLFPHALTALALAVVAFPGFAELGSRNDPSGLMRAVDDASGATVLLTLPAAVGMALIAPDLVEALFEHGRFGPLDSHFTTQTTIFMVMGLPLLGIGQLHARAFYALGRPGVPARMAGILVLLNLVLGLLFVLGFGWGTAGLAAATSLSAGANAWGLRRALARVTGPAATGRLSRAWLRCAVATAGMALVVHLVRSSVEADGLLQLVLLRLLLPVAAGMAAYAAGYWLLERRGRL